MTPDALEMHSTDLPLDRSSRIFLRLIFAQCIWVFGSAVMLALVVEENMGETIINTVAVCLTVIFVAYFAIDGVVSQNTFQLLAYVALAVLLLCREVGSLWYVYASIPQAIVAVYAIAICLSGT